MDARTRWALVVILAIWAIAMVIAAMSGSAHAGAPPLVKRDAAGRRTGTIETRPGGGAIVRDPMGRRRETIEPSGSGWVRRDAQGRRLGTIERGR